MPFCTWLMSLVMRVIKVEVPMVSSSVKLRLWIWASRSRRRPAAEPMAAFAAKYWAVKLQLNPSSAISSIRAKLLQITWVFPVAIPSSMMRATSSGTVRSKPASSILNAGARMLWRRYFFI